MSQQIILHASAIETDTNAGTLVFDLPRVDKDWIFDFDVTAAATEVGDILEMFIETRIATKWIEIVHFVNVLGNGGAKRFVAKINAGIAESIFEPGTTLAAGSVRNIIGRSLRARWDITDAGADNASWTFELIARSIL